MRIDCEPAEVKVIRPLAGGGFSLTLQGRATEISAAGARFGVADNAE